VTCPVKAPSSPETYRRVSDYPRQYGSCKDRFDMLLYSECEKQFERKQCLMRRLRIQRNFSGMASVHVGGHRAEYDRP